MMSRITNKGRGSPANKIIPLDPSQKKLVEEHLQVVHWVIKTSIHVNESIYGFSYEDLFQEGCIWLCRAAISFDEKIASFPTYAKKVVRNGLISYCRNLCFRQKRLQYLEAREHGELMADGKVLPAYPAEVYDYLAEKEILELLESLSQEYAGVTRLGIEAIAWKVKGLELKEIAAIYQVPSTYVGAWISRSAKRLRGNERFLQGMCS